MFFRILKIKVKIKVRERERERKRERKSYQRLVFLCKVGEARLHRLVVRADATTVATKTRSTTGLWYQYDYHSLPQLSLGCNINFTTETRDHHYVYFRISQQQRIPRKLPSLVRDQYSGVWGVQRCLVSSVLSLVAFRVLRRVFLICNTSRMYIHFSSAK